MTPVQGFCVLGGFQPALCGGDLGVQACADDPQVAFHAVRNLARISRGVAPIRVATGEHVHNRVMFKQLFQAGAIDVCQIDACRLAGVNEAIAVLLLAAKFGTP